MKNEKREGAIRAAVGDFVIVRMIQTRSTLVYGSLELFVPEYVRERQLLGAVVALPSDKPNLLGLTLGDLVVIEDHVGSEVGEGLFRVPARSVLAKVIRPTAGEGGEG